MAIPGHPNLMFVAQPVTAAAEQTPSRPLGLQQQFRPQEVAWRLAANSQTN